MSKISHPNLAAATADRCLVARPLLALALGLALLGQNAVLRAQDAAKGTGVVPSNPATAAPSAPIAPVPSADVYLINPNDVLDVLVYDVPELSHSYTVTPSGMVNMPLLSDPLPAAGLSPDQVAREMEDAFRKSGRLLRPIISVTLSKQTLTSSVAVEGAVKNPSILPEIERVKLVDIITQCGGLTDDVGNTVTITRSALALRALAMEGGPAPTPQVTVDLKKVMDVRDPASATAVWPGDRVSVERQKPEVYYVLGEVKSPGGYSLKSGQAELTVLRALALAGDITSVAKKSDAFIIRKDPKGPQGRSEIKLDLKSILKGNSADPVLQADDILFVPGSNGKKALHVLQGVPAQALGSAGAAAIIVH
jgi:polysaccharide biosynthesis/export protein